MTPRSEVSGCICPNSGRYGVDLDCPVHGLKRYVDAAKRADLAERQLDIAERRLRHIRDALDGDPEDDGY